MESKSRDTVAVVITFVILACVLFFCFSAADDWAARAFAKAQMGSALVTVIEIGMLLTALCLAPPLSKLVAAIPFKK